MYECCHYCKPPKRYPGCHDHCPDKQEVDDFRAERKAIDDKARGRDTITAYAQRVDSMNKAYKKRKGKGR